MATCSVRILTKLWLVLATHNLDNIIGWQLHLQKKSPRPTRHQHQSLTSVFLINLVPLSRVPLDERSLILTPPPSPRTSTQWLEDTKRFSEITRSASTHYHSNSPYMHILNGNMTLSPYHLFLCQLRNALLLVGSAPLLLPPSPIAGPKDHPALSKTWSVIMTLSLL